MDLAQIASRVGITADSARTYHTRAQANRRKGTPKPGDLPPPDYVVAGRPAWNEETVDAWISIRPGKTGRPAKGR